MARQRGENSMLHAIAAFLRREGETLERAPAHEMLRVGLCLAFTGGFLDAYTYLLRGGVFANAQTGNMVLMALYAARRDGRAFYYLPVSYTHLTLPTKRIV